MFRRVTICPLIAAVVLLLGACSGMSSRPVMPVSEVIVLSKAALPDQAIQRIDSARTTYALRGSDFARLADAGVPPSVLDYLQQAFVNDVDLLTRYWVQRKPLGTYTRFYPQPVDLAKLADGGDGMADIGKTISPSTPVKPQGLPEWVTVYPGSPGAPALTIGEIRRLIKESTPETDLSSRIGASRLRDFMGTVGGGKYGSHLTAGLTGSELAQLKLDGASEAVLDALQQKFLAEYIEFSRIRYLAMGHGSSRAADVNQSSGRAR